MASSVTHEQVWGEGYDAYWHNPSLKQWQCPYDHDKDPDKYDSWVDGYNEAWLDLNEK